jgi:hypothetical protein
MTDPILIHALNIAEGPLFRAAFALLLLGTARGVVLAGSDIIGAYLTLPRADLRRKMRMRLRWELFPSRVLKQHRPELTAGMQSYHLCLCLLSLITRAGAILIPAFMAAHVYLWEQAFGLAWPALPGLIADTLSIVTIVAGLLLFLGRLYSPMLRKLEPNWSFLKPLILVLPFLTGFLAMHPTWSPLSYHAVRLLHVLSAEVLLVMIPFARLLSCMHTRVTHVIPEAIWQEPPEAGEEAGPSERLQVS